MGGQHRLLWILQWIFGLYFIGVGVTHFIVPDGLPTTIAWMYDLHENTHRLAGTAEILGGLGLILPGLTGILPKLTSWAAIGLAVIMVLAIVWHARRDETSQMVQDAFIAVVMLYIAYGRWKLAPLPDRSQRQATA